jgi:hypothetical protein
MSNIDLGSNIGDEVNAEIVEVPKPVKRRAKAKSAAEVIAANPGATIAPVGMPDTIKIIVEENESIPPTGLFVGLNGRGYLIRPGEEVNVPRGVVDILDNAKMSTPVMDSRSQRIIAWRDRLRYPYRRLS